MHLLCNALFGCGMGVTMHALLHRDVCIVGCGRWLRGDDQAGLQVVKSLLHDPELSSTTLRLTESPGADLPNWLDGVRLLVLVDAARCTSVCPPGAVQKINYRRQKRRIRERVIRDSHSMSVDFALSLAEQLGTLPPDVWVYAIAAEDCGYGEKISPPVLEAMHDVSRRIQHDVKQWINRHEHCHA